VKLGLIKKQLISLLVQLWFTNGHKKAPNLIEGDVGVTGFESNY